MNIITTIITIIIIIIIIIVIISIIIIIVIIIIIIIFITNTSSVGVMFSQTVVVQSCIARCIFADSCAHRAGLYCTVVR